MFAILDMKLGGSIPTVIVDSDDRPLVPGKNGVSQARQTFKSGKWEVIRGGTALRTKGIELPLPVGFKLPTDGEVLMRLYRNGKPSGVQDRIAKFSGGASDSSNRQGTDIPKDYSPIKFPFYFHHDDNLGAPRPMRVAQAYWRIHEVKREMGHCFQNAVRACADIPADEAARLAEEIARLIRLENEGRGQRKKISLPKPLRMVDGKYICSGTDLKQNLWKRVKKDRKGGWPESLAEKIRPLLAFPFVFDPLNKVCKEWKSRLEELIVRHKLSAPEAEYLRTTYGAQMKRLRKQHASGELKWNEGWPSPHGKGATIPRRISGVLVEENNAFSGGGLEFGPPIDPKLSGHPKMKSLRGEFRPVSIPLFPNEQPIAGHVKMPKNFPAPITGLADLKFTQIQLVEEDGQHWFIVGAVLPAIERAGIPERWLGLDMDNWRIQGDEIHGGVLYDDGDGSISWATPVSIARSSRRPQMELCEEMAKNAKSPEAKALWMLRRTSSEFACSPANLPALQSMIDRLKDGATAEIRNFLGNSAPSWLDKSSTHRVKALCSKLYLISMGHESRDSKITAAAKLKISELAGFLARMEAWKNESDALEFVHSSYSTILAGRREALTYQDAYRMLGQPCAACNRKGCGKCRGIGHIARGTDFAYGENFIDDYLYGRREHDESGEGGPRNKCEDNSQYYRQICAPADTLRIFKAVAKKLGMRLHAVKQENLSSRCRFCGRHNTLGKEEEFRCACGQQINREENKAFNLVYTAKKKVATAAAGL